MSRIPPEHQAARGLEESFRRLGEERSAARRRRKRPSPIARVLVTALAALLAVSAAAAGTKVFLNDGGSVAPESQPPGSLKRSPADRRLAQAKSADPVERAPWGLRLYTGAGGKTCVLAGRLVGGRIGVLQGTTFTELPWSAPGVCTDLNRVHVLVGSRRYGGVVAAGGRSLLYGVADRTVSGLALSTSPAVRRPIPIAADGTFIVALQGSDRLRHAQLLIDGPGGTREQALGG
jgi:hypothetical protein